MGEIAGKDGEPPSASDESCPLTGALCGDEVPACSSCIAPSPSSEADEDEAFVIHGIGDSKGEADGEGDDEVNDEERSIGLVVELDDIVDACPNIEVSAGPGESANVSDT